MTSPDRYAVVSCHVERPLDDEVWRAFERLLERRPAGFAITPFVRPPDPSAGEDETRWLERARRAAELAPLGHHTHWGGPTQARPAGDADAAGRVRAEAEWLRSHGLAPRYFCGGGWYLDAPVAETLATLGYVDCTATTLPAGIPRVDAPRLQLDGPRTLRLPSGAQLLELPATHSLGMLARGLASLPRARARPLPRLGARRPAARDALDVRAARCCGCRRRPIEVDELARHAADAPAVDWPTATINDS